MGKKLVIIESGGKISKVQKFLGSDYEVVASYGHIIDLPKGALGIDVDKDFEPTYVESIDKKKTILDLKRKAKSSSDVLLAADEDREGEMIAWSIAHILNLKNPKRLVYNAITKEEIEKAVKNPRDIDMDLVDAAKARRMLDRLVGYKISPLLWKSVRVGLSAGRVQSVVVRLIIDRENDIKTFFQKDTESYFKFFGYFPFKSMLYKLNKKTNDGIFKGEVAKLSSEAESKKFLTACTKSDFIVANVDEKTGYRNPSPPFNTYTLQQEAYRKLGMAIKRTMTIAQNLYDAGHITYMRTDSINLSDEAIREIKKYVVSKYGKEYHREMKYKSKGNTQEAHEAVRPTVISSPTIKEGGKIGYDEQRLYGLIWRRAVASQMSPAKINIVNIQISISKVKEYYFSTTVESIVFNGFLEVYNVKNVEKDEDEESNMIGDVKVPGPGDKLKADKIEGIQEFEKPPSRYNEASLLDKLKPENLNIGRPATIASIISKIQEREYVSKGDIEGVSKESLHLEWDGKKIIEINKTVVIGKESNKFIPTELGIIVNNILIKHFADIMDYQFTAKMEDKLDEIASGKKTRVQVLKDFYKTFKPLLDKMNAVEKTIKSEYPKVLGIHNEKEIKLHFGRKGYFVSDGDNSANASEDMSLKDAIKALNEKESNKFNVFKDGDTTYTVLTGRFGPYISVVTGKTKKSIGLPKDIDPKDVDLDKIKELEQEKDKNKLAEFTEKKKVYTILNGKYGPYISIKDGKKKATNVKLPKDTKIDGLTLESLKEIIDASFKAGKGKYKKKTDEQTGGKKKNDKPATDKPTKTLVKKDKPTKTPVKKDKPKKKTPTKKNK